MRVHQPSLREPTVEPWSSHLCLVSPRLSTSWAWVNLSLASCLKKTTKKHLLSAFPSHNASHQPEGFISFWKKSPDRSKAMTSRWVFLVLNLSCWMLKKKSLGGSLCLPSCLWWHTKIPVGMLSSFSGNEATNISRRFKGILLYNCIFLNMIVEFAKQMYCPWLLQFCKPYST